MSVVELEKEGHLAIIRLNRPGKKNALNAEVMNGLKDCWNAFMDDEDAWLAILTSNGTDFSVGADFSFLETIEGNKSGLDSWLDIKKQDPLSCGEVDKPTIAAINGYCLGAGLVIALNTDLRVCAQSAKLQVAELVLGFPLLLLDNLPHAITAELNCGTMLSGQRAYEIGLVNRVVPDDQLMSAAVELANELLSRPPLGVYHGLKMVREQRNSKYRLPSDRLLQLQKQLQKTEDCREALAALKEKRKPLFKRR